MKGPANGPIVNRCPGWRVCLGRGACGPAADFLSCNFPNVDCAGAAVAAFWKRRHLVLT